MSTGQCCCLPSFCPFKADTSLMGLVSQIAEKDGQEFTWKKRYCAMSLAIYKCHQRRRWRNKNVYNIFCEISMSIKTKSKGYNLKQLELVINTLTKTYKYLKKKHKKEIGTPGHNSSPLLTMALLSKCITVYWLLFHSAYLFYLGNNFYNIIFTLIQVNYTTKYIKWGLCS